MVQLKNFKCILDAVRFITTRILFIGGSGADKTTTIIELIKRYGPKGTVTYFLAPENDNYDIPPGSNIEIIGRGEKAGISSFIEEGTITPSLNIPYSCIKKMASSLRKLMSIESMLQLDQVRGIYPRCPVGCDLFHAIFSTQRESLRR